MSVLQVFAYFVKLISQNYNQYFIRKYMYLEIFRLYELRKFVQIPTSMYTFQKNKRNVFDLIPISFRIKLDFQLWITYILVSIICICERSYRTMYPSSVSRENHDSKYDFRFLLSRKYSIYRNFFLSSIGFWGILFWLLFFEFLL